MIADDRPDDDAYVLPPTPERVAKGDLRGVDTLLEDSDGHKALRRVVRSSRSDDWLMTYFRRRLITEDQHAAGRRLASDWNMSNLRQRVTAVYADQGGRVRIAHGVEGMRLAALDAFARYSAAMAAVGWPLNAVVRRVACMGEPASTWAVDARNIGGKAAQTVGAEALRMGLDALTHHYRVAADWYSVRNPGR